MEATPTEVPVLSRNDESTPTELSFLQARTDLENPKTPTEFVYGKFIDRVGSNTAHVGRGTEILKSSISTVMMTPNVAVKKCPAGFSAALLLVLFLFIVAMALPMLLLHESDPEAGSVLTQLWLRQDPARRAMAVCHLCAIPALVIALCIMWLAVSREKALSIGELLGLIGLVVAVQLRKAIKEAIVEERAYSLTNYMAIVFALILARFAIRALKVVEHVLDKFADDHETATYGRASVQKWLQIMGNFVSHHNEDKDEAWGAGQSQSPARVLASICGIYMAFGKLVALLMFVMVLVDIQMGNVEFGIVLVLGFIAPIATSVGLYPAIINLVPIVLTNPFYIGEIISLTKPGDRPPDNPGVTLTGFVETVTVTHVVMRDFRRKQTFIPHANFVQYNIHNWTRRPCRLIMVNLVVSSHAACLDRLVVLQEYARRWIDNNEKVDKTSYVKAVIVSAKSGPKFEFIMYPLPGVDSYPIRQNFILAVLQEAQRLQISLVPEELMHPFPKDDFDLLDDYEKPCLQV